MLLSGLATGPAFGATVLQCVPYARIVSGVDIQGDALTWWDRAEDHYKRGHKPKKGAVLAFRPFGPMTLGHVAVVSKVLDGRHVLVRHANWSSPGAIEEDVPVVDVSEEGDWSAVRVWHGPTGQMGVRTNPTFGFIYPARGKLRPFVPDATLGSSVRLAAVDPDQWRKEKAPAAKAPAAPVAPGRVMLSAGSRQRTAPRLEADPAVARYADNAPSQRTLGAIIADIRREAALD